MWRSYQSEAYTPFCHFQLPIVRTVFWTNFKLGFSGRNTNVLRWNINHVVRSSELSAFPVWLAIFPFCLAKSHCLLAIVLKLQLTIVKRISRVAKNCIRSVPAVHKRYENRSGITGRSVILRTSVSPNVRRGDKRVTQEYNIRYVTECCY